MLPLFRRLCPGSPAPHGSGMRRRHFLYVFVSIAFLLVCCNLITHYFLFSLESALVKGSSSIASRFYSGSSHEPASLHAATPTAASQQPAFGSRELRGGVGTSRSTAAPPDDTLHGSSSSPHGAATESTSHGSSSSPHGGAADTAHGAATSPGAGTLAPAAAATSPPAAAWVTVPNTQLNSGLSSMLHKASQLDINGLLNMRLQRSSSPGVQRIYIRTNDGTFQVEARPDPDVAKAQVDWPVWWFAPFFDRTSFGKEAATLVLGMMRSKAVNESNVWLGTTQGDCKYGVDTSMPQEDFAQLDAGVKRADIRQAAIVVCHSLPPFWSRPLNKWATCAPCPPIGYKAALAVGRAMAETDIYNPEFVRLCNRMDEVWVPSKFSLDTLVASGMDAKKLRIVPIAVNTTLFDPDRTVPLKLPMGDLVFGRNRYFMLPSDSSRPVEEILDENDPTVDKREWRKRLKVAAFASAGQETLVKAKVREEGGKQGGQEGGQEGGKKGKEEEGEKGDLGREEWWAVRRGTPADQ